MYCDFPMALKTQSRSETMFKGIESKMEVSGKLKVTQATDFEFGKFPGKMLIVQGPNNLMIKEFLIASKDRLYQVMAVTKSADIKDPAIDQFFNSFSLKGN